MNTFSFCLSSMSVRASASVRVLYLLFRMKHIQVFLRFYACVRKHVSLGAARLALVVARS